MIRFGIIGTNWITDAFLQAARECDDFALTAIYSRTEERARQYAGKHGAAHIYTDVEAMADSGEIDAVYIASPNSFHAEHAIACMKRGVHVLCEKPIASNASELRNMIAAARSHNVVLMEAMKSTLMPNFQAIRDNLHGIGKVRRYFASYCQYSSRYDAYKQGNVMNAFNPVFSNGALMDLGIYCLYPAVVLFGKPDAVRANGVLLESGIDGEGSLLLRYPEMDAVIMYSKITHSSLPSEIQGENGNLVIEKISQPEKVEIRYRDGTVENLTRDQADNTMVYEIKEFINLIKSGQPESSVNSLEHSLWTMEIMDEARRQMGLVYPADAREKAAGV
ncbi:Gfo/Idh/MocA family oxidoreductase [Paenibacillus mesophilus]|uniref:Gfo/Idh/MocA family protein n=1 Tax=Paenibacillus mesophilus TaxID=2582849 RepID=UPI00110EAC60|nr:Gfo/Idh/MocA family oxidoreductase [Paenibacillus mesophilus]TMV49659.1 Gfo/Idh/MocA family oxidoreductase [Paenibacillus mesophilus]